MLGDRGRRERRRRTQFANTQHPTPKNLARPARSATAATLLNADVGYSFSGIRLQVSVLNLTNERADDIQYYYASRLQGDAHGGWLVRSLFGGGKGP